MTEAELTRSTNVSRTNLIVGHARVDHRRFLREEEPKSPAAQETKAALDSVDRFADLVVVVVLLPIS